MEVNVIENRLVTQCSNCKKYLTKCGNWINWKTIDDLQQNGIDVSHGLCPKCIKKLYPDFSKKIFKTISKNYNYEF